MLKLQTLGEGCKRHLYHPLAASEAAELDVLGEVRVLYTIMQRSADMRRV